MPRGVMALCFSSWVVFYLLFNIFPYAGFMAISLLPGLTEESAGPFAGLLIASFMMGRAGSAYGWGVLADIYGRKFVLISSLSIAAVGSFWFGWSSSYWTAFFIRFGIGFGNGIMTVFRTAISEVAKGDNDLESKGIGQLTAMVGYGMLISPAIGGLLSDPLKQHPDWDIASPESYWYGVLSNHPFLIPNWIASLLSILAMFLVVTCVEETLPEEQRRPWNLIGTDFCDFIRRKVVCFAFDSSEEMNVNGGGLNLDLQPTSSTDSFSSTISTCIEDPDDFSAAIPNETTPLTVTPTHEDYHSTRTIFPNKTAKAYLMAYWTVAFVSVCDNEAFPLFAMSQTGGLGLIEKDIGIIGTCAGLVFCVGQYFAFTQMLQSYRLIRTLRKSAFWGNVPVLLIPISRFLSGWWQTMFLASVIGFLMVLNAVYFGCTTMGANRSVEVHQRAALNGLSSLGTSIGRGLGPLVAGILVATCMSFTTVLPPAWGGWCIYVILSIMGVLAYGMTRKIPAQDGDESS